MALTKAQERGFWKKKIAALEKENAFLKGRNEGFEMQIMGLLIKYEEVYKRFPDLKSAMDKAKEVLKENEELKQNGWHNLRKNPQDLPKEDGAVLVVDMDYGHPGYTVALFWKKDGAFTGHRLAKLDVIAWREIPVFQEEKTCGQ